MLLLIYTINPVDHLPSLGHVDLSIDHLLNHHLELFWFSINEPRRVGEYR